MLYCIKNIFINYNAIHYRKIMAIFEVSKAFNTCELTLFTRHVNSKNHNKYQTTYLGRNILCDNMLSNKFENSITNTKDFSFSLLLVNF